MSITQTNYAKRRSRFSRVLKKLPFEGMLLTHLPNIRYLTGFSGSSASLIVRGDDYDLLSDSRYTTQIGQECSGLQLQIRHVDETMLDLLIRVIQTLGLKAIGVEGSTLSVDYFLTLNDKLANVELIPKTGLVEELRMVKDSEEIAQIRFSINAAQRGFQRMLTSLKLGQTEVEIRNELEYALRGFGAEGTSFDTIVAIDSQAALPHAKPGTKVLGKSSVLLIDYGARMTSGYRCDITRTMVAGNPSAKFEKVYNVVLEAQQAAIEALKPGVSGAAIDKIARDIISKAGYGKSFGHGLGHGFGLEIHEALRLAATSQQELQPGMVVTVEPGIYLEGWGGVRIEDDILITRSGHEVLTNLPKTLDAMSIYL